MHYADIDLKTTGVNGMKNVIEGHSWDVASINRELKNVLRVPNKLPTKNPAKYVVTFINKDEPKLILSETAAESFAKNSRTTYKDEDLVFFTGDNDETFAINKKCVLSIQPLVINTLA